MFGGRDLSADRPPALLIVPTTMVGLAGVVTVAACGPYALIGYFVAAVLVGWLVYWRIRRGPASGRLDVRRCPTERIGYAWQVTSLLLDKSDPAVQLRLVQSRQEYLDELHRRNPHAIDEWARQTMCGGAERPDIYLRNYHKSTEER
jgi:hypothetical protein